MKDVIEEPFGSLTFIYLFTQASVDLANSLIVPPLFDYLPASYGHRDFRGPDVTAAPFGTIC